MKQSSTIGVTVTAALFMSLVFSVFISGGVPNGAQYQAGAGTTLDPQVYGSVMNQNSFNVPISTECPNPTPTFDSCLLGCSNDVVRCTGGCASPPNGGDCRLSCTYAGAACEANCVRNFCGNGPTQPRAPIAPMPPQRNSFFGNFFRALW